VIYVIDNFDSFTYNLVQYLGQEGGDITVVRNNEVTLDDVIAAHPAGILLSPGPCDPSSSGVCLAVVQEALTPGGQLAGIPVLGVCLGMQAMGQVSGATVRRAKTIRHGKTSSIRHDAQGVFAALPNPLQGIRYHSLVVEESELGPDWIATAHAEDDGELMGMRHRSLPLEGVQFHPESVLSEAGLDLVRNWQRSLNRS